MMYQKRPLGQGNVRCSLFARIDSNSSELEAWLKSDMLWLLLPDEYVQTQANASDTTNGTLLQNLPWAVAGATHPRSRCSMRVDEIANPLQVLMQEYFERSSYRLIPIDFTPDEARTLVEAGCSGEFALERLLWLYTEPQWEISSLSKHIIDQSLIYVEFEHATSPSLSCSFAYHVFVFPKSRQVEHRVLCLDASSAVTAVIREQVRRFA